MSIYGKVKNLRTGASLDVKVTSYGDLNDGDEFVRWANYPVLVKDLPTAVRKPGNWLYVPGWNNGRDFAIHVMRRTPTASGWLREINMTDAEDVADFDAWVNESAGNDSDESANGMTPR